MVYIVNFPGGANNSLVVALPLLLLLSLLLLVMVMFFQGDLKGFHKTINGLRNFVHTHRVSPGLTLRDCFEFNQLHRVNNVSEYVLHIIAYLIFLFFHLRELVGISKNIFLKIIALMIQYLGVRKRRKEICM